jgi:hypothetical protein
MKLLLTVLLITMGLFGAALTEGEKGQFQSVNLITKSPGFEADKYGWSNSGGTFALTTTAANVASGKYAGSFDASSTGQYIVTSQYTLTPGLYGHNCVAMAKVKGGDANLAFHVIDGSSNILATTTLADYTTYQNVILNFVCPSSGTVAIKILSSADAAIFYVDDAFIGDASLVNVSQVNQAQVYGTKAWATTANCVWSSTSATMADFSADADCDDNARTLTGNAIADASNDGQLPQIRFPNMGPGHYMFILHSSSVSIFESSSVTTCNFAINDGTTEYPMTSGTSTAANGIHYQSGLMSNMDLTTAKGDTTLKLQAKRVEGDGTCYILSHMQGLKLSVYRFPLSSELAYRPDTVGGAWSAIATLYGTTTSATLADPGSVTGTVTTTFNNNFSCVAATSLVGITCSLKHTGMYQVCSGGYVTNSASDFVTVELYSGTEEGISGPTVNNIGGAGWNSSFGWCANYNATTLTPTFKLKLSRNSGTAGVISNSWSVTSISPSVNMPILVGSVTSNTSGQERIERADLTCGSSSSINKQSGSWISAFGNRGSSKCAVTIASGIFSSSPVCVATRYWTSGSVTQYVGYNSISATSGEIYLSTDGDMQLYLICQGPR